MNFLKKFWPLSFVNKPAVSSLVKVIIIYVVIAVVFMVVGMILGWLNLSLLSVLFNLISTVVELYCTAGVVFSILHYLHIFN